MSSSKRVAEYAKSNRSACKKCKQKLDKGELRIGVVFTKGDAEMTSWYHPACMPQPKKEVLEVRAPKHASARARARGHARVPGAR